MAFDPNTLTDSLFKTARILCEDEQTNSDATLQALIGDPSDARTSTFVQFKPNPGTMQLPNPLSPIEGEKFSKEGNIAFPSLTIPTHWVG